MKRIVFLIFLVAFSQCKSGETNPSPTSTNKIAIVIHGGAGTILKENLTPELEQEYKKKLEEAVRTGYKILQNGGSSLDAVEKTINILEDSPLFNVTVKFFVCPSQATLGLSKVTEVLSSVAITDIKCALELLEPDLENKCPL